MVFIRLTLLTFIFLSGQMISKAQSRFQSHLRFDYIFNGINESTPVEYDQFLTLNKVKSKPSFAIGVQYDFFIDHKKKVTLNLGTLFEFRSFTRLTHFEYEQSNWSSRYKQDFQSRYLSVPIGLTYNLNKIKISASLVNLINLRTKLQTRQCGYENNEACEYWQQFSITNDFTNKKSENFFALEDIYADNWYHQQLTIGLQYQVSETVVLGIEYRDFIRKNKLNYHRLDWDVYIEEEFEQQSNSLHLMVLYLL